LAQEVELVEEEGLRGQLLIFGLVEGGPAELDALAGRDDVAAGSMKCAVVGSVEGAFDRSGRPVSQYGRDFEPPVREGLLEPRKAST
jgi:hypothetical protein